MKYGNAVSSEFENIDREIALIESLLTKSRNTALDDIEIRAAALSLSTVYNGIEKVLEFAMKDQHVNLPTGSNWHAELLEIAERHLLIDQTTRAELLGFMAFRHFIRHAYSFEIEPDAIVEILSTCPHLVKSFRRQIEARCL